MPTVHAIVTDRRLLKIKKEPGKFHLLLEKIRNDTGHQKPIEHWAIELLMARLGHTSSFCYDNCPSISYFPWEKCREGLGDISSFWQAREEVQWEKVRECRAAHPPPHRLTQFNRPTSIGNPNIIVYTLWSAACGSPVSDLIGRAWPRDTSSASRSAERDRAANGIVRREYPVNLRVISCWRAF